MRAHAAARKEPSVIPRRPRGRAALRLALAALLLAPPLVGLPAAAQAQQIVFPPRLDGQALLGAGVRTRWGMQVYAIGLYADQQAVRGLAPGNASAVMLGNFGKTVDIRMMRKVSADKMREAFEDGLASIRGTPEYQQFLGYFRAGELHEGTRILLQIRDGVVHTNIGGQRMPPIASRALASALMGVWIGPDPVSDDLKQQLLARLGRF